MEGRDTNWLCTVYRCSKTSVTSLLGPSNSDVDILMVITNSVKSLTTLRSWAQKDPTEWSTLQLVKSRLKEDDGVKEYQGIVYRTLKQVLNCVKSPPFF